MRPVSSAYRDLLGATHLHVHARARVANADGVFVDLTNLGGYDWFDAFTITEDIDQPVASATLKLRREAGDASIAPTVELSAMNRRAGGAYGPLLDAGRGVYLDVAVTPPGVEPVAGDWVSVFQGKADSVAWGGSDSVVSIPLRDRGAYLLDTVTEVDRDYGSEDGTAVEVVMQAVLDDNVPGFAVIDVPDSPGWMLHPFTVPKGTPVLTAMRDLALQIGWDLRFRWAADGTYKLTFFSPDRVKSVPDFTLGPDEYFSIDDMTVSDADVRNRVVVSFTDHATGERMSTSVHEDLTSVARYGRRFMEIGEAGASNIDSLTEANALADAALADLSTPGATHSVATTLFWPAQLGDLGRFLANDVHYDVDQDYAVVGISTDVSGGHGETKLTTRGKPAGAYKTWITRGTAGIGVQPVITTPTIGVKMTASARDSVTYDITATSPAGAPVSVFIGVGGADFPAVPTFSDAGSVTVLRGSVAGDDRFVRVRAVGPDGATAETQVVVDYDSVPEIVTATPPVASFSGPNQSGWDQSLSVDDDTESLLLDLYGDVTLGSVSPAPYTVVNPTTVRVDTRAYKNVAVSFVQPAGGTGGCTYTPHELYSAAGSLGAAGPQFVQPMQRSPVTVSSVREASATLRDLTLTVTPATATIFYRQNGGAYQAAPGPTVTVRNIDVSAGPVTVDFYSRSASLILEQPRSLTLDQGTAPAIVGLALTESPANNLRVTPSFNSNVALWKVWARRGSSPLDAQSNPLPDYLKFFGTLDDISTAFAAAGAAADPADRWYVVVRAYDRGVRWAQSANYILVGGVPPGALYNVRVNRMTVAAQDYNAVLWDHNDTIEAAAGGRFTVSVYLGSAAVITGMNPKSDELGAATPNMGGHYDAKTFDVAGGDHANYLTFDYEVRLYDSTSPTPAVPIATYFASVSGYYSRSGSADFSLPSDVPPNPTLRNAGGGVGRATWLAGSASEVYIEVDHEVSSNGGVSWDVLQDNEVRDVGSDEATYGGGVRGRARLRYVNNFGPGDWSGYSGTVVFPF